MGRKKDFSIYELYRKYKKKQLILEVDFQRNELWGYKQKCELIESILMGLPLPIFYFKQQNNSTYVDVPFSKDNHSKITTTGIINISGWDGKLPESGHDFARTLEISALDL